MRRISACFCANISETDALPGSHSRDWERIIQIQIEHLDDLGDLCRKTLVVEIMGKHSNIIFCDADGQIIDSIKHISAQMSSVREVLPGRPYFIPDTMGKKNPLTVDADTFIFTLKEKPCPLGKAIYTSFTGISPVIAEDICFLAGMDSGITPKEYEDDLLFHLYRQFSYYIEDVKAGNFHPVIYTDGETPKEFSALLLSHFDTFTKQEYDSISEVLQTLLCNEEHAAQESDRKVQTCVTLSRLH